MPTKAYYLNLRKKYHPGSPRLIFVAESPPASGKYFYDPSGRTTEPLFRALMQSVLSDSPRSKTEGLAAFKKRGCVLVDATYRPVNKGLTGRQRDNAVLRDYSLLKDDLLGLAPHQDVPLLLIKVNVCRLLEPRLSKDGFDVLNCGTVVPFPASGNQRVFHETTEALLRRIK